MEHAEIRALLIDDDPGYAALVQRSLKPLSSSCHRIDLERTATLQEGMDRLGKGGVDVLLLDLKLPDSQGIDTVVRVRECDSEIPIVVLTATGEEEAALRALRAGAQDYLVKTELTGSLLSRVTRYAIERQREKKEREQIREHLFQVQKRESLGVLAGGVAWGIDRDLGLILDRVDIALDELASSSRLGRVAVSLK
jgi:DNA-binding response OmpR family regulator